MRPLVLPRSSRSSPEQASRRSARSSHRPDDRGCKASESHDAFRPYPLLFRNAFTACVTMALNDSPVAFATCLISDTRLSGTLTVKTTFRSGTGTVRFILRASSTYRYACLLETPNRSMIIDKVSSLEEPPFNRERATLTRSASSACGDLLLMCHNYTTSCVIMSSNIFVPNSGISHRLFKLKVIYCVGGVMTAP